MGVPISWTASPIIVEVPTWPWLAELSAAEGRQVSLADVPETAWDAVLLPGVDVVWLMGVWERSPAGRALARADQGVRAAAAAVLPDVTDADIVGSPYCVHRYVVDDHLGGPTGLAAARAQLARRGVGLLVDFVPNHVAIDHPWIVERPDLFVRGTPDDLAREPHAFFDTVHGVVANGRDPYFPPWTDVAQLDSTKQALRDAVADTLLDISEQADGVRCDMAMLLLDDVVVRTWVGRIGLPPPHPYWSELIGRVRAVHPGFGFVAEAYWDRESDLIAQGFDHCYDKRLTDRLLHEDADSVRAHLGAAPSYQGHLVRFLENHDEARVASVVDDARNWAASITVATLPGALMLFERQWDGWRVRPPVQLGRRPVESVDESFAELWERLLSIVADDRLRAGAWTLLDVAGWPDNQSCRCLVAWQWLATTATAPGSPSGPAMASPGRHVVVVNLSDQPAAGRVLLDAVAGSAITLVDRLTGTTYERDGDEVAADGLFVSLGSWGAHLFAADVRSLASAQVDVTQADGTR